MLDFQTLACIHDIPVIRSSTDKLQDVYTKAKDTSILIRFPCNVAETVADKSLKIALTIANPFVKPFSGPARVIDDYAVQKLRQIESKYPAINTPTEDVVNTFNEKTEPVRNVMNSVKDTTSSTIQHGKETVSNAATATVNKATGVADSVFSFCEAHVPGIQRRDSRRAPRLSELVSSAVESLYNYVFQSVESSIVWFRMLVVFFLLRTKQINDLVLSKIQQKPILTVIPQRLLIVVGAFLEYFIGRIRPDDRTLAELKKTKQQSRLSQKPQYVANRENSKGNAPVTTRQSVVVTKQETVVTHSSNASKPQRDSNMTDADELRARLGVSNSRQSSHNVDNVSKSQRGYSNSADAEELRVRLGANNSRQSTHNVGHVSQPDYSNMTDEEELHARLANNDPRLSAYNVDDDDDDSLTTEPVDLVASGDIELLHNRINATDIELLYSRIPSDVIPDGDNGQPLTADQQTLHARLIGAELERQGYDGGQNGQ